MGQQIDPEKPPKAEEATKAVEGPALTPVEQLAYRLASETLATLVADPKDQWKTVIEEYLWAAESCIPPQAQPIAGWTRSDGKLRGYAATLLLLCAIDAMGQCLLAHKQVRTRFDVLTDPNGPFRLPFKGTKKKNLIDKLAELFRDPLAHNGMMRPNVFLDKEREQPAFCFEGDTLTVIQVPALYDLVERAWKDCDTRLFAVPHTIAVKVKEGRGPSAPRVCALSSAASGLVLISEPLSAFPSCSLVLTCNHCGKEWMVNEKSHAPWRDRTLRDILQSMRHDGCGGLPGKAELLIGIEGVSSRPVQILLRA